MIEIQPKETPWNNSTSSSSSSSSTSSFEMPEDRSIPTELLQSLRHHSLFQRANNENFIEQLACCMHLRTYSPHDNIIVEGEAAKAMFFLLRGTVEVCSADFERVYATLQKGSCFGEIGILYSIPRTATVIASTKCIVAALTVEDVKTILPQYPEVEKILRFEAEERLTILNKSKKLSRTESMPQSIISERNVEEITSARNLLQKIPYFQNCPEELLHLISLKVEPRHYVPNSLVLKKGDVANELFFIINGTVEIINVDATPDASLPIERLSVGDYFGDIAVILNTPRIADARAVTDLELYVLKKSDFSHVLERFPDLYKHFITMAETSLNHLKSKVSLMNTAENNSVAFEEVRNPNIPIITPDSVCSTTSDQDPTLLPTTKAEVLKTRETRRRRASVAIWSDPNLVALANRHMKQSIEESKLKVEKVTEDVQMTCVQYPVDGQFSSLNDDILGRIMNHLDIVSIVRFATVSKKCYDFVKQSEKILKTIDLSMIHKRVTDDTLKQVSKFAGKRVHHVNLSQCYYITDDGFKAFIDHLPSVETMDLNSCWLLTDKSLSLLAASCPLLTNLDLSNCRKISDIGLFKLLDEKSTRGYPALKQLSLSYCKKLSDMTMGYLAEFCANSLEQLNIQRCTRITDQAFIKWSNTRFFNLKDLNLTDCSFLTDLAISHLVAAAPQLRNLTLSFCCALSDNAIESLTSLSGLQHLDASFCGAAVSDVSIHALLRSANPIKSLNLRGCVRITDTCVKSVLELVQLESFNISQCPGISLNTKELARNSSRIQTLLV